MNFNEYQERSRKTAKYPGAGEGRFPTYLALGLCGETGEFADKIKKSVRDDGSLITCEKRELLKLEMGDVLWYLAQIATELGFSLEEVAEANIEKIYSRLDRNAIGGSGDKR